jgi:hypothetical protein
MLKLYQRFVMFNKFSRGGSEEEINIRLNLQPDCRWL